MKNYYQILGVNQDDSSEVIKKAYRKLAIKFHPDTNQGDTFFENYFKELHEAYETLSHPAKRKEYDKSLNIFFNKEHGQNHSYTNNYENKRESSEPEAEPAYQAKTEDMGEDFTSNMSGVKTKAFDFISFFKTLYIGSFFIPIITLIIFAESWDKLFSIFFAIPVISQIISSLILYDLIFLGGFLVFGDASPASEGEQAIAWSLLIFIIITILYYIKKSMTTYEQAD